MRRLLDTKQTRRMYETEPDVFELEEMRERRHNELYSDRDDNTDGFYEEAFDCVMNLYDEILDAEDDTEVDECIVNARLPYRLCPGRYPRWVSQSIPPRENRSGSLRRHFAHYVEGSVRLGACKSENLQTHHCRTSYRPWRIRSSRHQQGVQLSAYLHRGYENEISEEQNRKHYHPSYRKREEAHPVES